MAWLIIMLVIIALIVEAWSMTHSLDGVEYDVSIDRQLVEIDQPFHVITELRNRSRRFIPFLRMVEDLPGGMKTDLRTTHGGSIEEERLDMKSTVYLRPRQLLTRSFPATMPARGRYTHKGATLFGGDFLGLKETTVNEFRLCEIVVLPKPWRDVKLEETLGGFLGDISVNRFIMEDPVLTLGFREYTGREPQKMIAWPQSLRAGKMMVKNYDYTIDLSVTVVLNVYDVDNLTLNHARMETAYSMTRSVVEALEEKGIAYSFYTNASAAGMTMPFNHITEGLGTAHLNAILEGLGRATYIAKESFYHMADTLVRSSDKGRSYIVITTNYNDDYAQLVNRLKDMSGGDVLVLRADTEQEVAA